MADRDRVGYILIDRNILEWKWWNKHNTLIVFLYLILKANFHDSYFDGVEIKRGQVAITHAKISQQSKLTIQQVRTSLNHLISTGEITIERRPKFLVITISNYDRYQNITINSTDNQQSSNNHSSENQQYPNTYIYQNKRKNEKEKGRSAPIPPPGYSDKPYAEMMPDADKGTVDDIPDEFREQFKTYEEYWRFRNR